MTRPTQEELAQKVYALTITGYAIPWTHCSEQVKTRMEWVARRLMATYDVRKKVRKP